jgi:hypothetical protein
MPMSVVGCLQASMHFTWTMFQVSHQAEHIAMLLILVVVFSLMLLAYLCIGSLAR